ncbi:hypothetical protein [Nonomuraea jabiensis]|uniref:hypothetical protein n=1 Tax=Nonomuraea jabiensis TaxID=882448 RepID=UPI003D747A1E
MAEYQAPIRGEIGSLEFEGATLDLLRDTLAKNKPQLIGQAAAEFLEAKVRLDNLVDVIDKHLRELDKHWTAGEDAKTVKKQLRRLREAAADISTTISDQPVDPKNPPKNPHGVAPALIVHARTLSAAKGDVPDNPGSDIDFGEAAVTGGVAGAAIGSFFGGVGAVPGVVIGAGVGVLVGGITRFISDLPFANLWGDSKEEKDRKKAAEAIKLLSQDTKLNNDVFPAQLRTDIPQFMALAPNVPTGPFGGKNGIGGNIPAGLNQAFDPTAGLDGLNQDGMQDPGRHQIPGIDTTNNPTSTFPDGGTAGTVGGVGNGQNGIGGNGQNGAGNVPGLTDPSSALNANANANLNPNANGSQGPNAGGPTTSLAGIPDPSVSGPSTSLPNTGIGSPYGGSGVGGNGFGGGGGASASTGNGVSAAALRGLGGGGSSVVPTAVPPGGRGGQEPQEIVRTTYLLEDEDLFRSDVPTINQTIKGDSKGKA